LMKSDLQITSELGQGTEVFFRLKLQAISLKPKKVDKPAGSKVKPTTKFAIEYAHLKDKRILVAEDNSTNALVIAGMLELAQIQIALAKDGYDCLKIAQKRSFDLILMDVQMPNLDGIETTKLIRQIEQYKNIPIIAFSAGVSFEERGISSNSGMNDFLSKPIDIAELFEKLDKWLVKLN
jgi:CheY-like chemotaxis protein